MDYFLSEEEVMVRDTAREISKEKVLPVRKELDETGEFPKDIMDDLAKADLFRIFIPTQYGGLSFSNLALCLAIEEIAKICAGVAVSYAANMLGGTPIILFGREEVKKRYLPSIAEGKSLCAFALTEADAGSDVSNIVTKAVKDGDQYIINGTKQWITNGGEADIYVVIVSTTPERGARGLSAIVVEKGTEGFSFGKKEDKLGIRASVTRELIFQDVRVPKENLLGREGAGFLIALRTFDITRPGVGAQAIGIAQGALDEAVKYARTRKQFGKTIINFEGIGFLLAELATKLEAARALVYQTARQIDIKAKDISKYSSMAKLFASDVAMEVTIGAVQVLGGYGYMREYPVEKYLRDAKITQIYEGTNEIQKLVIANALSRSGL
ncbi:acyl-CoA dehydrogenase family protein [candidate division WOR-3 bacterium]|nr:acyl-CoA dehydrogenase family protein [candidate division WOR-3 bacterium]